MAKNVESVVERWRRGTSSSEAKQKYVESIEAVTESPMEKAASPAALELYARRTAESVTSGRRAARLKATPLSRWKEQAKKKGSERLASGATGGVDKMRTHMQTWLPIYENVSREVQSMPKGTREDSKARAARAIDMLMDAAGK